MSASREKKQRQDLLSQGPTQRQLKEQREAKARKQKIILYSVIGVIVAVAVIALLVWNSGIFQRRVTAATVGGKDVSVSEMQIYYNSVRQSVLSTQQMYAAYGITTVTEPYQAYDFDSELGDKQVYNSETGQTYEEYFEETALESLSQVYALTSAAEAEGYQLSDEGKANVDEAVASLASQATQYGYPNTASFLIAYYGRYATESAYRDVATQQELASEYQTLHQDSLTYTEADYDAYAKENPTDVYSYDYRYVYISGAAASTSDEDGNTVEATEEEKEAAMAEAKEKADALVAGVQAAEGDKSEAFNTLVVDAVGESSSYADPEYNLQDGILGVNITSSLYHDWVTDASRTAGDISSFESSSGYWVVLFEDSYLNNAETVDVRHILIKAELTQDDPDTEEDESADEPTDEQMLSAHDEAERILNEFNALSEDQRTAEAFGELAEEYSDDSRNSDGDLNAAGGLYTYVEEGTMVESFNDWIFDPSRTAGDTGLVENDNAGQYGWHVMYFQGLNGPKWHEVANEALLSADMESWLEELTESCQAVAADGMSLVH